MTSDRDIERILDHWLTERPTQVSDRVLDEVADRIARHPQQPAWRVSRRDFHVSTYLKPLLAVAAVVVIAVAGLAVLQPGAGSNVGGPASPSPSSTPTSSPAASASPSASAVFPSWFAGDRTGAGILPAGSHSTESFRPGFTFSVPEGWVNDTDSADFYGLFPDTPANEAEFALSGAPAQGIFMGMVDTPTLICDEVGETQGSTSAGLADSLVTNEALVTSEPVDVAIGGLTGTRVDSHLDPDWTGTCPPRPDDPPTKDYKDYRGRFIFLDTPSGGKLLIIIDSVHAADFEAHVAEAMPIVESFQFDLTP
jgi:hypothetical protein